MLAQHRSKVKAFWRLGARYHPRVPGERDSLRRIRRYAVGRSLFGPTTLARALEIFGFVQADPIRAPARAQDLTLRHRVAGYQAGDLERHYAELDVHEDVFVNYGFVTGAVQALMHPRGNMNRWPGGPGRRVDTLLAFVRERGSVHPREVDARFSHGSVTNYWGGSSNATTHLLDALHYRGRLRVARREAGIRIYSAHDRRSAPVDAAARRARLDALVDVVVRKYAPLPAPSLAMVVRRLRYAVPQWQQHLTAALTRARDQLGRVKIDGVDWYFPAAESPDADPPDQVRLLAPFDPIVWDRRRFEVLWGWPYRFEAYTPAAKRRFGYYALPLLWQDRIVGWGNVTVQEAALGVDLGFVDARPRGRAFQRKLDEEIDRLRAFLAIPLATPRSDRPSTHVGRARRKRAGTRRA
jgi:hypothetical protein